MILGRSSTSRRCRLNRKCFKLSHGAWRANRHERDKEWRRRRQEVRSGWLRLVVLLLLAANIFIWEHGSNDQVHLFVLAGYGLATLLGFFLGISRRNSLLIPAIFATLDAMLVVALFHEHLFGPDSVFQHRLSAPKLVISFVLLAHIGLRFKPWLVILFTGTVVLGWLSLLAMSLFLDPARATASRSDDWSVLSTELTLVASFGFSALVCYILTKDHNSLLAEAVESERHRRNLSRFFSPYALSELETRGALLKLERRRAVVMFVDLRSFSSLGETLSPEEVAAMLAEYRQLVTQAVFDYGGIVDKFIGDGVMVVFGQPNWTTDSATKALQCALEISSSLAEWKQKRLREGKTAVDAGIGLHAGPIIGGVLSSGTHDEFTVLGDTVNIAERLERLSKTIGAAIVTSQAVLMEQLSFKDELHWVWRDGVELEGRKSTLDIAYLPRAWNELAQ